METIQPLSSLFQGTGSNGNAGPVNAAGFAIDPAAETYKKQIVSNVKASYII